MQGIAVPLSLVPGHSIIHKLNPLPKMTWAGGVLLISLVTRNPAILGTIVVLGLLLVLSSGIVRPFLRVVVILFPIFSALIVLQSVAPAFPRPWTPITSIGPLTIYQEGVYSGVTLLLRVVCMTVFALVAIMTSHPSDLFASLQKVRVPYVLNFILAMTLQLLPILQREFWLVLNAQKSRGMKGSGFGAILPSMVPVFVGAIERVQQLSISLESRAFGSSGEKTSYRNVTLGFVDYLVIFLGIVLTVATLVWIFTTPGLDWSHKMTFPPALATTLFFGAAAIFVAFFVVAVRKIVAA